MNVSAAQNGLPSDTNSKHMLGSELVGKMTLKNFEERHDIAGEHDNSFLYTVGAR